MCCDLCPVGTECREAVTQNSPGLQPWVRRSAKSALKVAAEARLQAISACYFTDAPNVGCHFQGTSYYLLDPGLKPWAVLYSRFAAESDIFSRH